MLPPTDREKLTWRESPYDSSILQLPVTANPPFVKADIILEWGCSWHFSQKVTSQVYEGIKRIIADSVDLIIELKGIRQNKQTPRDMPQTNCVAMSRVEARKPGSGGSEAYPGSSFEATWGSSSLGETRQTLRRCHYIVWSSPIPGRLVMEFSMSPGRLDRLLSPAAKNLKSGLHGAECPLCCGSGQSRAFNRVARKNSRILDR